MVEVAALRMRMEVVRVEVAAALMRLIEEAMVVVEEAR